MTTSGILVLSPSLPKMFFCKFQKVFIWFVSLGSKTWFRIIFGVFEFLFYEYWNKIFGWNPTHAEKTAIVALHKRNISTTKT